MSELRPCPWCGEEITLSRALHDSNLCLIKCRKCKVDMGTDYSQRLFHAWNTRPIEDALNAQIKDQEATIDALLNQNQTQMLELEKHEEWQKEAVEIFLSLIPTLEDQRCPHWHIKKIKELIKQAEDN